MTAGGEDCPPFENVLFPRSPQSMAPLTTRQKKRVSLLGERGWKNAILLERKKS
jgi:hypothetical protein